MLVCHMGRIFLAVDEFRDGFHRARPVQRNNGADFFDGLRLHTDGNRRHPRGFQLKDAARFSVRQHLKGRRVVVRNVFDVEIRFFFPDHAFRIGNDGQVPQTEKVHFDKAKIADASIDNAKIDDAAIGTANIQDGAIVRAKILDGEIVTAKIADLAVTGAKIADLAVTTAKIAQAAITNAQIAHAAVGTAQIALGAITSALIAQGAIGTAQIEDGSITNAKIVDLTANKINAGTLSVERLIIRGSDQSLIYAINNMGELVSAQVDTRWPTSRLRKILKTRRSR